MIILASHFKKITKKAATPSQTTINLLYGGIDQMTKTTKCYENGVGSHSEHSGWFWAEATDHFCGATVGQEYRVYSKAKADGSQYGSKVLAPIPPYDTEETPTDACQ